MFYSCCKAILMIFLGFAVAINANAKNRESDNIVMCPTLDKIHQAASLMNDVKCKEKYCGVSTGKPAFYENGLSWILATGGIIASSENEAILKAQNIAKEVTVMFSDLVMGNSGGFCFYYVGSSDQANDEMIGMVALGLDNKHHISLIPTFLSN